MGIISHVIATFSRKPVFGYKAMVYAMMTIAGLGFVVWGHHMFVSGMSPYSAVAFSILTMAIGVPSAIKTFNWIGTMWGGRIRLDSPMLYAIGFVSIFVAGGITGLFLGQPALDMYFHDTYFVVAHFHLIMGVAAILAMFAGLAYWFPKMFGRSMSEPLNKLHFWLTLFGVYGVFGPMHFLGTLGHPRRYAEISGVDYLADRGSEELHYFITIAAMILVTAQLIFLVNFVWSLFRGKPAGDNPWQSTSLEWTLSSPPAYDNFEGRIPVVQRRPYEYSVPGRASDFAMQTESEETP